MGALRANTGIRAPLRQERPHMVADVTSSTRFFSPNTHALPIYGSTFIGRADETQTVVNLLRREQNRLVTLLGPGGIGKTRLALEVATRIERDFACETRLVPLENITDHLMLGTMIAKSFVSEVPRGADVLDYLCHVLADRRVLLILDNLEHLPGASSTVAHLLAHCARITVLATSRAPLEIRGEQLYSLPPLAIARSGDDVSIEEFARTDAIRLFLDRVRVIQPSFRLTHENAQIIAAICEYLDGLPLAIELAAAQVSVLPPELLLAHIKAHQPLPVAGPSDAPDRLQTMRNAISWSHALLSDAGQRVFRRLGVFPGDFSLATAECLCREVAVVDSMPGGDATGVIGVLGELISHSLLRQADWQGEARYSMLRTIRHFALDCLIASGEAPIVEAAHADILLERAEQAPWAWVTDIGTEIDRLEPEHPGFLAALAWYQRVDDASRMARLAIALTGFWYARSHDLIGRMWVDRALKHAPELSCALQGRLHVCRGLLSGGEKAPPASAWFDAGISMLSDVDDAEMKTVAHIILGAMAYFRGDYDRAEAMVGNAILLTRYIESPLLRAALHARALANLEPVALARGDTELAARHREHTLRLYREYGSLTGLLNTFRSRGILASERGDFVPAMIYFRDCIALSRPRVDQEFLLPVLDWCGVIAVAWGKLDTAARLLGAVESLSHSHGVKTPATVHDRALAALLLAGRPARIRKMLDVGRRIPVEDVLMEAQDLSPQSGEDDATSEPSLTKRELDVLSLLADGLSNREIAEELFLSVRTVESHVIHLCRKLGSRTRIGAVAIAVSEGIIDPGFE